MHRHVVGRFALCAFLLSSAARAAGDPPADAPPDTAAATAVAAPPAPPAPDDAKPADAGAKPAAPTPKHTGGCRAATPALSATTNATFASACGAKPPALFFDDAIAIGPGGTVKLGFRSARRDHDSLLEETCTNTAKLDVVVRVVGREAPWIESDSCTFTADGLTCADVDGAALLKCTRATTELPSSRMLTGKAEEDTTNPVAPITPYAFFGGILTTVLAAGWTGTCFYFASIEKDPDAKIALDQDKYLLAATTGTAAAITLVLLPFLDWSLLRAPPGGETGEKPDKDEAKDAKDAKDADKDIPTPAAGG